MGNFVLDCILKIFSEHKEIVIALIAFIGVFFTAYIALRNKIKGVRALLAKSKIWKRALTPLITQP
jgi:hypothetical protein